MESYLIQQHISLLFEMKWVLFHSLIKFYAPLIGILFSLCFISGMPYTFWYRAVSLTALWSSQAWNTCTSEYRPPNPPQHQSALLPVTRTTLCQIKNVLWHWNMFQNSQQATAIQFTIYYSFSLTIGLLNINPYRSHPSVSFLSVNSSGEWGSVCFHHCSHKFHAEWLLPLVWGQMNGCAEPCGVHCCLGQHQK